MESKTEDRPTEDSEWYWNEPEDNTFGSNLSDVPITVLVSDENYIMAEVEDKELLQDQLELAKRTMRKNGGDQHNAAETVEFVTNASGGVVIASKKHFFSLDRFYEECDPR